MPLFWQIFIPVISGGGGVALGAYLNYFFTRKQQKDYVLLKTRLDMYSDFIIKWDPVDTKKLTRIALIGSQATAKIARAMIHLIGQLDSGIDKEIEMHLQKYYNDLVHEMIVDIHQKTSRNI